MREHTSCDSSRRLSTGGGLLWRHPQFSTQMLLFLMQIPNVISTVIFSEKLLIVDKIDPLNQTMDHIQMDLLSSEAAIVSLKEREEYCDVEIEIAEHDHYFFKLKLLYENRRLNKIRYLCRQKG